MLAGSGSVMTCQCRMPVILLAPGLAARTIREAWGFGLGVLALNVTESRAVAHEDPPG